MADIDISRAINLIMSNPELLQQIKGLAEHSDAVTPPDSTEAGSVQEGAQITKSAADDTESLSTTPATAYAQSESVQQARRRELLCALKPYVSESRAKTVDSIITIAEILSVMRKS